MRTSKRQIVSVTGVLLHFGLRKANCGIGVVTGVRDLPGIAVTCANKALSKAQVQLKEERLTKPLTTLCYATNQVANWSLKRIYSTYRVRFGIESSYRQSRQARLFTTSRKAWFRFLIFGLSMILRNLWIEVRWLLGEPKRGRGGRKIAKDLLPFPMFLRWLVSAVWKALRFTTWIDPQTELPNPLWRIS